MVIDHSHNIKMTAEISVSEFKATCLEILREIESSGQSIVVTRHGRPVAEVHPPRPRRARSPIGIMKGRGTIQGDILSPATPDRVWEAFDE